MKHQILPHIPRVPIKILSANGPEFANSTFNDLLQEHNIKHIYSTPYLPSSNGAVERINKTVIELLKGLSCEFSQWDDQVSKVILTCNNTFYSQINTTPSQCILNKAHSSSNNLPLDKDTLETWKQGYPNLLHLILIKRL